MKARKQWIAMLLMLAMLFTALPLAAFAEETPTEAGAHEQEASESSEGTQQGNGTQEANLQGAEPIASKTPIRIYWKSMYDSNIHQRGYYNPADEGKKVDLYVLIDYERKSDPQAYAYKFPVFQQVEIGKDFIYEVDNPATLEGMDKQEHDDWTVQGANVYIMKEAHLYRSSSSRSQDGSVDVLIAQQMNIDTKAVVQTGTTVQPEDWDHLKVKLTIEKQTLNKKGEVDKTEYPLNNPKRGVNVEETLLFPKGGGEFDFFNKATMREDPSFYMALYGGYLENFQPYDGSYRPNGPHDGRKAIFKLHAEWTGDHKDELNKRYKLDVTGNDLDGWTVTLSNLPEEKPEKPQKPDRPFVPSVKELILFDANGGAWANGETRREYRSAVGSVIPIEAAPTREGYKFLYWKGSEFHPGESYTVPAGGHTFVAQWEKVEKPEDKPAEKPSVDAKIKTPRGSALTAEEIAKILAGSKKVIPTIPKAGVGR